MCHCFLYKLLISGNITLYVRDIVKRMSCSLFTYDTALFSCNVFVNFPFELKAPSYLVTSPTTDTNTADVSYTFCIIDNICHL